MPRASQCKLKGDVQLAACDVSNDLFDFLNIPAQTKRLKSTDSMTSNRFQCLVDESVDSSIHRQELSSATNTAVSDLEMETEYDPSNDQLAHLERYVVEQGVEIINLKHKVNYLLKFIGVEQDVDGVDAHVNETCFSVSNTEKWSERVILRKDKDKTNV